jgi:hypothetical protein
MCFDLQNYFIESIASCLSILFHILAFKKLLFVYDRDDFVIFIVCSQLHQQLWGRKWQFLQPG